MTDNKLGAFGDELKAIRRHLHSIPELGLEEVETSDYIASTLEKWGYELSRGLAKTGIVASLRRGNSNRSIGFRADFDALPILEETGLPYASRNAGKMHACGHDGHTAMLLGAAWSLAQDQDFSGTVHFIFQPAEENFGGAQIMIEEGLFERFPCDQVFALHNWPGLQAGKFASKAGPIAASIDALTLTVKGSGGHGAEPEKTVDPIIVASSIVMALQTIVARNVSPHQASVITVGAFNSGAVCNVIPDTAKLEISMRATDPAIRKTLRDKVEQVAKMQAASYGADVSFDWMTGYPATINDAAAFEQAKATVTQHYGQDAFEELDKPFMGSEDFSFMLEKTAGAYLLIGNGESSGLHTSKYNFNDEILERGVSFFHNLAKDSLKV
ncbi:amidohydrolase [Brucella pituitosa]|uniref:M20 aminoacylase family protein n=1 Tax=Brucella pituitosa TaxID=571256 RepID=UPI000C27B833|nr:M20 aminoacylase family protein [Brucella pituitosa]MCK4206104.1 amidohydrolase [Brucella pituitosa]PJO49516.1 amidohydrolase [Brucella pituitosa]PRA54551.1 amidohydrolase [Ochrobactrum sp. MYb68]PRA85561.1 amidohydrolase [Ochrobactrum sp. MYb29]